MEAFLKDLTATADIIGIPEGFGSIIAGHPFDTIKVRLQTVGSIHYGDGEYLYNGAVDCFYKILRREGVFSLYNGISLPLISIVPINILTFYVYNALVVNQARLTGKLTRRYVFLNGVIAGIIPAVVVAPVERFKVYFQIPKGFYPKIRTMSDVFKNIYREEGMCGLFRGFYLTAIRDGLSTGFSFVSYYWLRLNFLKNNAFLETNNPNKNNLKYVGIGISGGASGVISTAITIPIDFLKTRYQIRHEPFQDMLLHIRHEARLRNISILRLSFTGTPLILVRSFCQYALTFVGFEVYKELLRKQQVIKKRLNMSPEEKKGEGESEGEIIDREVKELEDIDDNMYDKR